MVRLNNSIDTQNCCNQAHFLSKETIMKCLETEDFAWHFLQPQFQKHSCNSTHSYYRKP